MGEETVASLEAELQAAYDKMMESKTREDIDAYRALQEKNIPLLQQLRQPSPLGPGDVAVTAGNVGARAGVQKGA
jgi:hypothetical protein